MERSYSRRMPALLLLLTLVAICPAGQPAVGQEEQVKGPRLLTAVGSSEVRVRPDQALVRLGVETEAKTAAEAREQNAARVVGVVNALKALGIPQRQIETSVFQIYPIRRFEDEPRRGEPPIVGYRVVNVVTVRTEELDLAPRVIDESVEAGANRVENIDFLLKDENAARQRALKQAVGVARENAVAMAGEIGVRLIQVQSVQQGGVRVVRPPSAARAGAFEARVPTPIFPGDVTVKASVTLTYVIE